MGMPEMNYSGTTYNEAINDLLMSIALQESALAHVMNAEGEKIQATVAEYEKGQITNQQMLVINDSVASSISLITSLEKKLVEKMDLILSEDNEIDDRIPGLRQRPECR